ncbi:MAG: 3-phosphoshikimate 1-carboxyvinyltransferase [Candidatus Marinimicrobia bacterium CG08_land_8_20_14_0_20_45_22]|nr:MAG: 3-phosphoshikimate 1-carboxyvinyltransferase [Candidatus Marinimicrobia bacterium CG08_land_8_20_14_0_20_45_22]
MKKSVRRSVICGNRHAPASKSLMQRAIAAALLADGETTLRNPTYCADSLAALSVIRGLGASVERSSGSLTIRGGISPIEKTLNCGESGLCLRMFAPICALFFGELMLTGEGSLKQRPLSNMESPLADLGAFCLTENGYLPVRIHGPLRGGKTDVDGSLSSQFLTGLLMALPLASNDSEIRVINLKSKPYVDMTLDVLRSFQINIQRRGNRFLVPGNQHYRACDYLVEGDWSGVAFLLVAGAIAGSVTISWISSVSKQPDRAIIEVIRSVGAEIQIDDNSITVRKNRLAAFEFDATDCPDLFPPLVALAANCNGRSVIRGASRLIHKESNRAEVLQSVFTELGISVIIRGDEMIITGGKILGGHVISHGDHRIAMSAAIAGLTAESKVTIETAECVAKSYPTFFEDLKSIGGQVDE